MLLANVAPFAAAIRATAESLGAGDTADAGGSSYRCATARDESTGWLCRWCRSLEYNQRRPLIARFAPLRQLRSSLAASLLLATLAQSTLRPTCGSAK